MKIILTHIGLVPLPDYLKTNVRQIRELNKDIEIYLLLNVFNHNQAQEMLNEFNVNFLFKENYESEKIKNAVRLIGYGENNFWTVSMTRIYYLEECMKIEKLEDIVHFENDVLLYTDLSTIKDKLINTYHSLAITPGGFDRIMTGFFFIKNSESLSHMTQFWLDILSKMNRRQIMNTYRVDMVNEMSLLHIYSLSHNDKLEFFPILPVGKYSKNLDVFNSVFDPASYGQFVGGTPKAAGGAPPGFLDNNHHIGNEMIKNRDKYDVIWEDNIPYLKYEDSLYKINNLHIHCKRLDDFVKK